MLIFHFKWINIENNPILQKQDFGMVFCYKNCSELLREKIVLLIEIFFLKLEAEGREFANVLRSLEQFIQTVQGQNNFW